MNKREFIKTSALATAGIALTGMVSCESTAKTVVIDQKQPFTLPELGYGKDALEPHIDMLTMQIHHGKHHAGYVRKLNKAIENTVYINQSLVTICTNVEPEDTGVRNNAGGHYNHTLFWSILQNNNGAKPTGKMLDLINQSFGDYGKFKSEFAKAAASQFGSGWAWLCQDANGKLFVTSTPNQDNPLMKKCTTTWGTPILGLDVWEHAYYLKYQNKRKDYIAAFFNLINWDVANSYLK